MFYSWCNKLKESNQYRASDSPFFFICFCFYGIRAMAFEPYAPPSLNVINYITVKLPEQNNVFWKYQFQSFLSGQRLFGFVTGSILSHLRPLWLLPLTALLLKFLTQTIDSGFKLIIWYSHGLLALIRFSSERDSSLFHRVWHLVQSWPLI